MAINDGRIAKRTYFLTAAQRCCQFLLHIQSAIAGLVASSLGSVIWQARTRTTVANQRRRGTHTVQMRENILRVEVHEYLAWS